MMMQFKLVPFTFQCCGIKIFRVSECLAICIIAFNKLQIPLHTLLIYQMSDIYSETSVKLLQPVFRCLGVKFLKENLTISKY